MSTTETDCRTEEGEAVMQVDALIAMMRVVAKVDFALPAVREALKDLYSDKATQRVMGPLLDHARRDEHAQGRNRMPGNRKPGNNRYWTGGKLRFREHPDKPDLGIGTFTVRR